MPLPRFIIEFIYHGFKAPDVIGRLQEKPLTGCNQEIKIAYFLLHYFQFPLTF